MEEFGENIDLDAIESAYNQLLANHRQWDHSEIEGKERKEKVVRWKNAYIGTYEGKEKMIIPFSLKKRIFVGYQIGGGDSFESISFFIVSKNDGKYEFEIMTRLSDKKYQESLDAYADFSGLVIVEDVFGDFIKGYTIEGGKISGAVKKVESPKSDACVKIEWSLFSVNGGMISSPGLSHTEYYCPDQTILPVIQDNLYTSIGRISRVVKEVRYLYPELKERLKLITCYPVLD